MAAKPLVTIVLLDRAHQAETRVACVPSPSHGGEFRYRLTLPEDPLVAVRFEARLDAGQAWCLDHARTLAEVHGRVRPPFPVGRFVVIASGGVLRRVEFPQLGPLVLSKGPGTLLVESTLRDVGRCGLLAWGRDKFVADPRVHDIEVACHEIDSLDDCLWAEPYPDGAHAAMCLTDHADFDTCDKIRLLLPLFEQTGFRFTKSVFPHSDPHPTNARKREPGMENPEFRQLIGELARQGTEIAYHGLSPRIEAPAFQECARRTRLMEEFEPATWIDHGTGSYLFTRRNLLDGAVPLSSFLEAAGVRNYWSYFDIWGNPASRLSVWGEWSFNDWIAEESANFLRLASPARAALRAVRYSVSNLVGEFDLLAPDNRWKGMVHNAGLHWRLREQPAVLYTRAGLNALLDPAAPWVFDTVLLNHLGSQLSPGNLDRLCRESGLMLAHCYIGWQSLAGNVFSPEGDLRIEPAFAGALEHAAALRTRHRLCTLSFRDLRRSLTAFANTRFCKTPRGWTVTTHGDVAVTIAGYASASHGSLATLGTARADGPITYCEVSANGTLFIPARNTSAAAALTG
jgi:hypothetical protein